MFHRFSMPHLKIVYTLCAINKYLSQQKNKNKNNNFLYEMIHSHLGHSTRILGL